MSERLLIIAASGLAREVISACRAVGDQRSLSILDDDESLHGRRLDDVPVLGPIESAGDYRGANLVVCAGRGRTRRSIVERLGMVGVAAEQYASVIDPSVHVPASCTVGAGSILLAHTAITAGVTIGRHVVAMPNVTFTHDDVVADFATLCAGASLGGSVAVGEAAYLGMNASVREGLRVGAAAVLGMGAVLLRDLPAGEIWAGVPAAPLPTTAATTSSAEGIRTW